VNRSHSTDGWTLIEMLVVVIVTGILSAIAIPTYLNQANKAREAEAVSNIGQIARDQQAYYNLNGEFAPLEKLDSNPGNTANYRYEVRLSGNGEDALAEAIAIPSNGLRGVTAANWVYQVGESGGMVSGMVVCKSQEGGRSGEVQRNQEGGWECVESGAVPVPPITEAE